MVTFEVNLPDRIDSDIDRLVEQGDFLNREQAVEELLTLGVSAHSPTGEGNEEMAENLFTQAVDDQQDPASYEDEPL
jgi:Arc/MetJ-type ribon-helix-helix transcriptional regulator